MKKLVHQPVAICINHIKGEGKISTRIPLLVTVNHLPWRKGEEKRGTLLQVTSCNSQFGSRLTNISQGTWSLTELLDSGFIAFSLYSFSPAERDFLILA